MIEYRVSEQGIFEATAVGEIDDASVFEAIQAQWRTGVTLCMWDLRRADMSHFDARSVERLLEHVRADRPASYDPGRVAFLAGSQLVFGMMRMVQTLGEGLIVANVSEDRDELLRWLLGDASTTDGSRRR